MDYPAASADQPSYCRFKDVHIVETVRSVTGWESPVSARVATREMPDSKEVRPREFVVEADPLKGTPGVLVRGELDIVTAPRLSNVLDREIRASIGPFVVDLCDLDFLDSSGVNVLVRARALLGREDRDLIVICPPGSARRIFEMTNLAELLLLFDSREQAASALRPVA